MTTPATTTPAAERDIEVLGRPLRLIEGGQGDPLLVLHRDNGHPGWGRFEAHLAERFTVYLPSHPGFHGSDAASWTWLESVRDVAAVHQALLSALGLASVRVIGHGFGGWLAAEMATLDHGRFESLVLVNPMGILPSEGEIFDQFLVNSETYAKQMFSDPAVFDAVYGAEPPFEQLEAWETDREMSTRIAWRPYMYNRALPGLLAGVETPALVVAGTEDAVVPNACARAFVDALPNARMETLPAGHAVDLERPAELAELCIGHLA